MRGLAIEGYRALLSLNRFLPPPRILLNGHSKSGTHLLSDCVALMPKMVFSGRHFAMGQFLSDAKEVWRVPFSRSESGPTIDVPALRRFLEGCPNGMFVTAHARYSPEVERVLSELDFKHILILRDPRDIAVSHTKFVMRQRTHFNHHYYANVLRTDEERLMATITGFQVGSPAEGRSVPSIGESFSGYPPWRDATGTLVTRYEILVGEHGGGRRNAQLEELQRIGDFIHRPLEPRMAAAIANKAYGRAGLTYRKGVIGDWVNHFTDDHRAAFKDVAGDLLIELGYEGDHDW